MNGHGAKMRSKAWSECPEGEIRRMVTGIRGCRRRKRWSKLAAGGAVAALMLTAAGLGVAMIAYGVHAPSGSVPDQRNFAGGIGCREVIASMKAYQQKRLDEEKMGKISAHLAGCPHCREKLRQMTSRTAGGGAAISNPDPFPLTAAVLPSR